jgi:hypothetical protein
MSFREDLQVAWRLRLGARDAGHGLFAHASHRVCAAIGHHHLGPDDQQRTAPSFVRAGADAVGDALIVGAVLVRFFAFVALPIVRHYVWQLWPGPSQGRARIGDRRGSPVVGAPAICGTIPSGGDTGTSKA